MKSAGIACFACFVVIVQRGCWGKPSTVSSPTVLTHNVVVMISAAISIYSFGNWALGWRQIYYCRILRYSVSSDVFVWRNTNVKIFSEWVQRFRVKNVASVYQALYPLGLFVSVLEQSDTFPFVEDVYSSGGGGGIVRRSAFAGD